MLADLSILTMPLLLINFACRLVHHLLIYTSLPSDMNTYPVEHFLGIRLAACPKEDMHFLAGRLPHESMIQGITTFSFYACYNELCSQARFSLTDLATTQAKLQAVVTRYCQACHEGMNVKVAPWRLRR